MSNKDMQIKLLKTKETSLKDEMNELERFYSLNLVEEYRNFNNVFISSVKTYKYIFQDSGLYTEDGMYYMKGEEITQQEFENALNVIINIKTFIQKMIDKLSDKSKELLNRKDTNSVLKQEQLKQYKYIQQAIDDYIRVLL